MIFNIKTFNLKTLIPIGIVLTGFMLISSQSQAICSVNSSGNTSMGNISSISLLENGTQSNQFSAGLSCVGFSLAAANRTYLKYMVSEMPTNFINDQTGEVLIVNYLDINNSPIVVGEERDLSTFSLINIFSSVDGSLPFYAKITPGQSMPTGTYRASTPFKVKWYYSVPFLAVGGIGFFEESPGFYRGVFGAGMSWGSGRDASLNLRINVLPDCRISTNDINFGTAAFANEFEPVQTSMGIRCSAKTPYMVSLDDGLYLQNGFQRAMKSNSGNNFLLYEIYKNSTTERWGNWGSERWSSANATTNAGNYDAITQQGYAFTAKVLDFNPDNLPAGNYSDKLTVKVEF
ncbi:spore coat U domain-containing protein [Acinetobacter bereziniae]|uniref:Csu type fimbrial protein n=1 Tax=Acinetobacter bereziniae TaxID=106648 RepID=UPI0039C15E29